MIAMESVLILTPLAVEHAALCNALSNSNLQIMIGGHGKVQFALSTQLLIQKHSPRLVICAGAAGRLDPELHPLDVVVSEVTIEHDFNLRFIERPLPRFPGDMRTLEKLRRRDQWDGFRVHFGPLASGDEDVLSEERASELRNLTGARAVAWEGAGGARACRLHGVPFIEIRAITDAADGHAAKAFSENVKHGMRHVAEVIRELI
jgi:adenosylhomocysteine nucleosidase